jgi:hypothetical protein
MPDLSPVSTLSRSAADFIKSALRLVGALRSGLGLSNDELKDAQQVFNDLLDALSVERIMVPATTVQTLDQNQAPLMLKPGQQAYKLGNVNGNEDFLLSRPSRVERVSVLYSVSQPTPEELTLEMYDDVQWQGISNKSTTSILPQGCFPDESNAVFPDTVLSFWPVPTQANPVILYLWQVLQMFPDLTTKFLFPPAYARMLRYNLAVDLAAEFPCDLQKFQIVQKIASETRSQVAGINVRPKEAVCDEALLGGGGMGNIFTGTSNRSLKY